MAHPKHRFSKTRTATRRNNPKNKLKAKPIYIDPQSGEATLYHRVCIESGYYRGRQVMEAQED